MDCIFCKIVAGEAPSWTVYQDEDVSAFFNYLPATKGHILIIPNKHYENIYDLPEEVLSKISILSKKIALFYKQELGIDNLNILQRNGDLAGQEVMHYHMHLIPREQNDKVTLSWGHDESIRECYDELKDFIKKGL